MSDTIKRWCCPECGRTCKVFFKGHTLEGGGWCPGVATDALTSLPNLAQGPMTVDAVQYLSGGAVVKVLTFDPPIMLAAGDTLKVELEIVATGEQT